MKKKKILFLPAGIGLAHVGRCSVLALELKKRGYDIFFGIGEHGKVVLDIEKLPYKIIPELSYKIFKEKIKKLNPSIFSTEIIKQFVESELNLFKSEKPDLVVADARPTARISTKIYKIPLIALANVDATPFYDFSKVKVTFPSYWLKYLPRKTYSVFKYKKTSSLLSKIAPYLLRAITLDQLLKFNLLMIRNKKQPLANFFDFFTGDKTLLLDIPEYRPVEKITENVKIVGPIFWEGGSKMPKWKNKIKDNKKTIYVTASGTGDKRIFQKTLKYLEDEPYQVIATCGNTCSSSQIRSLSKIFFITDFLPAPWVLRKSSLIIFPGGSASAYQALHYGIPQLAVPINIDQEDSANQLERMGTALVVNPYKDFRKENFLYNLNKILNTSSFRTNTLRIKKKLSKYNAIAESIGVIEDYL